MRSIRPAVILLVSAAVIFAGGLLTQTAEALTQISRPNHFFLYEVWQNEDAFNKHEGNAATREFRTKMQPMLGAPFDQRPHSKLE